MCFFSQRFGRLLLVGGLLTEDQRPNHNSNLRLPAYMNDGLISPQAQLSRFVFRRDQERGFGTFHVVPTMHMIASSFFLVYLLQKEKLCPR